MSEKRIVQESDGDGWDLVKPDAQRVSAHTSTQKEAIDRGREILKNLGGGELIIKGRDGKIRDTDTIPPATDPNPPKDTK